jgi:hypothetical protein
MRVIVMLNPTNKYGTKMEYSKFLENIYHKRVFCFFNRKYI